ncbi:PASTA domain-containing protein [Mangrovimonas sp. YM274]|uniref:PASTA domain-containing protein n=1 Tax=Mangrovimonas sp. YM274 TaxID=3070660 RepID=UPI0027DB9380|nr:PASTA domain-containing protein [Mangrovimonas sp. YM274]WMI69711.1 PASTA domain-containing protein [Mangrovimonas sp. YM274]
MSLVKFLTSKVFLKQLALALAVILVLCFLILQWLKSTTNHGEFVEVPELKGKTLETVEIQLSDRTLRMEIQDSANYNPDYPKYSVIEQYPLAGTQVKENRKIYVILNPSGYRKVAVPDIVRRTFRQAKPTLEALGFEVGKIRYEDDLGKDEVIDVEFEGQPIKAGEMLPLTSKIDLVLGNGNRAE